LYRPQVKPCPGYENSHWPGPNNSQEVKAASHKGVEVGASVVGLTTMGAGVGAGTGTGTGTGAGVVLFLLSCLVRTFPAFAVMAGAARIRRTVRYEK